MKAIVYIQVSKEGPRQTGGAPGQSGHKYYHFCKVMVVLWLATDGYGYNGTLFYYYYVFYVWYRHTREMPTKY